MTPGKISPAGADKKAGRRRRRLQPVDREKLIVEEAIKFFAEVGFEGRTRDLAKRIGVTQPLLYRYFPNKESLVERVYQEVYLGRLKPEWSSLVINRSLPLRDRLLTFYTEYQKAIFNYEWVRIFMFSGLRNVGINQRYLGVLEERILRPICSELRAENGLPDILQIPISEGEMELVWSLHGQFFYRAVRKLIYNLPVPDDLTEVLVYDIESYLKMAPRELARIFAAK
jgi:AcrR family transcriptional regulator